ncbi:hypothetical protein ACFO0N_16705 [Halobium salinum]|uniref:Small CPxCG-related zinc finger protein n=1 Tax=Halobium salinum TaxID=1364940 RepID=A0ABD5PFB3_9EURY|nr:hypothetical protein [Halobium salinum]
MGEKRRIRITEGDVMEGGINCPGCGSYTAFGDIVAIGGCRAAVSGNCPLELELDLVVRGA